MGWFNKYCIMGVCVFSFSLVAVNNGFCGSADLAKPATPKTRVITDMKGRSVEIPDPVSRVALLGGPTGQIAYILGVQDSLCAVTSSLKTSILIQMIDPRISSLPAPRTTTGNINIEELIESSPELAICGGLDADMVQRKTRIPVAYLKSNMSGGFNAAKEEMLFYASIFKKEERAEKYIRYLDNTIELLRSRTASIPEAQRKKVFNGYDAKHLVTLGGDTFMHERIMAAGCINAADFVGTTGKQTGLHPGLGEVSMEQVLAWNPDILVINTGSLAELSADPRWQTVAAIKNSQIYTEPIGVFIFNRPTAESAVLYPLWLACKAYPQRFKDISLNAEVKKFYKEIFQFNLTDKQVEDILGGAYPSKAGGIYQ